MTTTTMLGMLALWTVLCSVPSSIVPGQRGSRMSGVAAFSARHSSPKRTQSLSSSSSSQKKRNNNASGKQNWYEKRKAGIRVASRGPKPPRWEKEGDDLYKTISNTKAQQREAGDEPRESGRRSQTATTYEQARALLRPFEAQADKDETTSATANAKAKPAASTNPTPGNDKDKPFLWGELSVGPVWKSRLVAAGYDRPTPIQVASYQALVSKKNQTSVNGNAILAAATGSGKSLAYLLPFLTSAQSQKRKKVSPKRGALTNALGRIWIMTPTMELAYQLQRTVDQLVVGTSNVHATSNATSSRSDEPKSSNILHVVEYDRSSPKSKRSRNNAASTPVSFSVTYPILTDLMARQSGHIADNGVLDPSTFVGDRLQEPIFLAGTPKLFLQLRKEIKKVLVATSKLQSNARYARQREARELREARERGDNTVANDESSSDDGTREQQLLYRSVALALETNLQTLILDEVDRLLQTTTASSRREHQTTKPLAQELLEALVWESSKTAPSRGNGGRSPSGYRGRPRAANAATPASSTLQIVCASATVGRALRKQLMYIVRVPSTDKAAALISADVRTKKDARLRKASLLPSNLNHSYRVLMPETKASSGTKPMIEALADTLRNQASRAPSLVFPGSMGVEAVKESLESVGFTDIRGLSDLRAEPNSSSSPSASPAPVYIVKERLARGLDLPHVRTVVLMGVPSNAASYAHLAGRTARQNTAGGCITLCWPREAHKLVSIAETLGLNSWKCLNDQSPNSTSDEYNNDKDKDNDNDNDEPNQAKKDPGNSAEEPWDLSVMTKTAIRSKTVSELRNFLESKGIATEGLRKASLVDATLSMKEK